MPVSGLRPHGPLAAVLRQLARAAAIGIEPEDLVGRLSALAIHHRGGKGDLRRGAGFAATATLSLSGGEGGRERRDQNDARAEQGVESGLHT
jgi:hypothetical protein